MSKPIKRARTWVSSILSFVVLPTIIVGLAVNGSTARAAVVSLGIVALIVAVALLKGRGGMLLLGIVGLVAWGLGAILILAAAIRLAKPESGWALAFYQPRKRLRAAIRHAPTQRWTKLCARCGHPFTTTIPTVILCEPCRGAFPFGLTPAGALGLGLGVGLVSGVFNNPHQQ